MTKRTPEEIGKALERLAVRLLNGRLVKGSGAGRFLKSDVADGGSFLWSCKNTDNDRIVITADILDEARRAARGTQGRGDNVRAGVIAGVAGRSYAIVELEDWVEVAEQPGGGYIPSTGAAERRRRARMSPMERRALEG